MHCTAKSTLSSSAQRTLEVGIKSLPHVDIWIMATGLSKVQRVWSCLGFYQVHLRIQPQRYEIVT